MNLKTGDKVRVHKIAQGQAGSGYLREMIALQKSGQIGEIKHIEYMGELTACEVDFGDPAMLKDV